MNKFSADIARYKANTSKSGGDQNRTLRTERSFGCSAPPFSSEGASLRIYTATD